MTTTNERPLFPLPPASTTAPAEWRAMIADEGSSVKMDQGIGFEFRLAINTKLSSIAAMLQRAGVNDPRKVVHGLKVGLALALVTLFYYVRPLYNGVGGAAMWAVMTVMVVFEYTVGGSLYKGLNRAAGTLTGVGLALGVHWVASKAGQAGELVIVNGAVFILASAVTFSRFLPMIKRRFDYGATIFIVTFSLVAVSGYRVDELASLAKQRLSTIGIGISICLVCMLICPVWAGSDLHLLIIRNMDRLADSLQGCVEEYFTEKEAPKALGFKCLLDSKLSEESLANLAAWEPPHGPFGFRHPWSQYMKVDAAMRSCAYCIEAIHCSSHSEDQASKLTKGHFSGVCMELSSKSAQVLKELSVCIENMRSSESLSLVVTEMKDAAEKVKAAIQSLPTIYTNELGLQNGDDNMMMRNIQSLPEYMPLLTVVSRLMEVSVKVEGVEKEVQKLAGLC